ncbi:ABC-type transport auxiliary lipoprotein family protein [Mangrovicella endophytica]|uniref:ABC-type transport auxiliary lipoprotein family protein n=1 Tax=Mangrovicella endophytica TaxID=2066697 RepID=UPI001FDFEC5C|nr:ABC-type transport auxiliary lipoprotein family protein [Mangrovicella endophytica]
MTVQRVKRIMQPGMKGIVAGLLALGLASCASGPAPDTYDIAAPKVGASARGNSRAQVLIPEPTAIKALDSDKIVVKPTPYTVENLGKSQWSDRLPRMVQLRLLQAFENTGRIGAVGVPGQGLAIDYQLVMEIRRFEIAAGGANSAVVEISVKALNDRNGTVVKTRIFKDEVPVSAASNADYVTALNRAFERVSSDIVSWTLGLI